MSQLSLCMPTNRNFARSKQAISEALAYCEARDAVLVLSDNSGDAEKQAYWRDRSPRIRYLTSSGTDAFTNYLASVMAATTPFILQIGDDDGIGIDPDVAPVDLAGLPADFIGVRPRTEVLVTGKGVVWEQTFSIDADTAAARVIEYCDKARNYNCAFYSIFRREPYTELMQLFASHHPTRGSFTDWALALALFAYGRAAYDPGTIFRYNADQWSDGARIAAKNIALFEAVGLPPETRLYQPLLMALDLFIFVCRPGTPLSPQQALEATGIAAGPILNGFLNQVVTRPQDYSETLRYLVDLAREEKEAFGRFQLALVMVDQLQAGLKDRYVSFYRKATMTA
nr:hypothetical protein [uncultured Gellertiella sp.]